MADDDRAAVRAKTDAALKDIHRSLAQMAAMAGELMAQAGIGRAEDWRVSIILRNPSPGYEHMWMNVTDDDPLEVAKAIINRVERCRHPDEVVQ